MFQPPKRFNVNMSEISKEQDSREQEISNMMIHTPFT